MDMDNEISTDELAWDEAVTHEGRRPGAVVSVRLDEDETARLRALAAHLDLNLSQVIRRALAAFETEAERAGTRVVLGAFTYGGTVPTIHNQAWSWIVSQQLPITTDERSGSGDPAPTSTEPTRIVERVTVPVM